MTHLQDESDTDVIFPQMTVDGFGLPPNLLGPHPDEFFQIMGRVVALTALLEHRLLTLYELLTAQTGTRSKVRGAGDFVSLCRDELKRFRGAEGQRLGVFLDTASECLRVRNSYVHSVWPAQAGDEKFAWRADIRNDLRATITFTKTLGEMRADLTALIELLDFGRWSQLVLVAQGHELVPSGRDQ